MTAAGAETNDDSIKSVCAALKDKQLHEVTFLNNFFLRQKQVINAGMSRVSSLGGSGGGQASSGAGPAKAEAKAEAKVEEVVEEEEEDMDLGDLFG